MPEPTAHCVDEGSITVLQSLSSLVLHSTVVFAPHGPYVGNAEGTALGEDDGETLGEAVGASLGAGLGRSLGISLGVVEG